MKKTTTTIAIILIATGIGYFIWQQNKEKKGFCGCGK
jgi:hypothetical protein